MKIYIDGLGYRNAKTEHKEVIWFLTQYAKKLSNAQKTALFLRLKELVFDILLQNQCFELMAFISEQVTTQQEAQRQRRKEALRIAAEKEVNGIILKKTEFEKKRQMKKLFDYYNTPN